jgi:hypothetical protein
MIRVESRRVWRDNSYTSLGFLMKPATDHTDFTLSDGALTRSVSPFNLPLTFCYPGNMVYRFYRHG